MNIKSLKEDKSIIFKLKDLFDSISFGFMPNQFINVIFYSMIVFSGFSWMVLGIANILKNIVSLATDLVFGEIQYYNNSDLISKIRTMSLFYAFSFFIMVLAFLYNSVFIFFIALVVSGFSVATQGIFYRGLVKRELKFFYLNNYYRSIKIFTFVSVISALISSYLFISVNMMIIPLEISSISFILSSYILFFLKQDAEINEITEVKSVRERLAIYYNEFNYSTKGLFFLINIALLNAVYVLTFSYLGVYIYENFKFFFFSNFTNIAVLFGLSIIISMLVSNRINHLISINYGQLPVIVFGAALFSLIPFSFYFVPHYPILIVATAIGTIGYSITRISSEVYLIKNNLHNKMNNLIMIGLLLLSIIFLFVADGYFNLFYLLFLVSAFVIIMFFLLLVYDEYEYAITGIKI